MDCTLAGVQSERASATRPAAWCHVPESQHTEGESLVPAPARGEGSAFLYKLLPALLSRNPELGLDELFVGELE